MQFFRRLGGFLRLFAPVPGFGPEKSVHRTDRTDSKQLVLDSWLIPYSNERQLNVDVFFQIFLERPPRDRPSQLLTGRFRSLALAYGTRPETARRLLSAILTEGFTTRPSGAGIIRFPGVARSCWPFAAARAGSSMVSPTDGFQKLRFRTHDGLAIETVVIPLHKAGTASVCLSSQVGCVMGCKFCATARMPRRRNLEPWEMIDQFVQARQAACRSGRRITGAVFMGMGEPFLNYNAVLAAAELLRCPYGGAIAAKAITISTVGLVPEIDRFTAEGHKFRLAISLGAATDAKRAELVPIAARTPVAQVMAAARRHALARRDRVMLAYVCISGVNVGEDDARALGDLIADTPVRLDLIDVTDPTEGSRPRRPTSCVPSAMHFPPRRTAGGTPLLRRQRHPGGLRHPGWPGRSSRLHTALK